MKRIILPLSALVALSATAAEMPTVYGKISKEIRYVSQDDVHARSTMNGVQDVSNSESRIGVKGNHQFMNNNATYGLELGVDSNHDKGEQRIRIRQAYGAIDFSIFKLTLGHTYTAAGMTGLKLDPLGATGASLAGVDQAGDIALGDFNAVSGVNGIGHIYTGRANTAMISKTMGSFDLAVSYDKKNDDRVQDDTTYAKNPSKYEVHAQYNGKNFYVFGDYLTTSGRTKTFDSAYAFGAKYTMGNTAFSAYYGSLELDGTSATEKESTYMMATVSHMIGADKIALTYGSRKDDTFYNTTSDTATERVIRKQNQISLGYIHNCSENIELRAVASMYKIDNGYIDYKDVVDGSIAQNDAKQFLTGMTLKF